MDAELLHDVWTAERIRLSAPSSPEDASTLLARQTLQHNQDVALRLKCKRSTALRKRTSSLPGRNCSFAKPALREIMDCGEIRQRPEIGRMLIEHVRRRKMEALLRK
jgi:hypothetical protein